jgi:hypothetical protein
MIFRAVPAVLVVLLLFSLAHADVGPAPPRPSVIVHLIDGGAPATSVTWITYNCMDAEEEDVGSAVAPVAVRMECANATCTNGGGWYYKLNPCYNFPGGHFSYELEGTLVRTASFNWSGGAYETTIDIRNAAVHETPAPPPRTEPPGTETEPVRQQETQAGGIIIAFAVAYALTLLVETVVLFLLLRGYPTGLIIRNSIIASSLTLPFVWFLFPVFGLAYWMQLAASEGFAFAAETAVYAWLFRGMKLNDAAVASLLCNAASFLIGLVLLGGL